jgi:hypothetical protein
MRVRLFTIAFAALIGGSAAIAQAPDTSPAPQSTSRLSAPSKVAQVEKWSTKQWNTARTNWAKEKAKWAACRHQSSDLDLTGRKSWAFLYDCMI